MRDPRFSLWLRRVVAVAGFLLLLVFSWQIPPDPGQLWFILLMALFVAIQVIFPLNLLSNEANLIQIITLGGAFLFGPVTACWAATLGIGVGYIIRWFEEWKWVQTPLPPRMDGLDALAMIGMHHIAMLVALPLLGWWRGIDLQAAEHADFLVKAAPPLLLYAGIHFVLYIINAFAIHRSLRPYIHDIGSLALLEFVPLPFIAIGVMSYPAIGLGALILLGGVPVILEVLIYGVHSVRTDLDRSAKELTSLNQISQALRSSLDLDQLLEEIHTQVSALFAVENFYIALLNQDEEQLWYPLAVKNSQRVYWPPRQLIDRLTDRVIRKRAPILLPHNARDALARIGLPAGEDSPTAWMGVPLMTSEKVIGCLGVFSFYPDVTFTEADVRWLTTLSGQVSVAIENTLRYQRTQRRADLALTHRVYQLSILEAVGKEMAAAIRSDRLLELILGYALDVTNSGWGSIALFDPDQNILVIKAVRGYEKAIASISAEHGITGRAVRTGQRFYVPDVSQDADYVDFSGGLARSQLSVPMVHEGHVLGVLTLESNQINAYSASDLVFVSQLAAHATIAVVNAELYAQAQERLSELAAVLNSVGEGLLVLDASGQITLANEALQALTNVKFVDYTGSRLTDLPGNALACLGYKREQAVGLVNAMAQGNVPPAPRATVKMSEVAPERMLERTASLVWDRKGRVTGCSIVLRNITEEIQISQARELITETLVHDLRSPASAVLGALDVLEETLRQSGMGEDEVVKQAVEVARRGGQRVLGMIESLLEIARLQSGKIEVSQTNFNLKTTVSNVFNDFISQALEYGIILRNEIPEDAPQVRGDLGKTTRVLTNLVDNALKFTPPGGQVMLTASRHGANMVAVRVSDTGPGVPEEFREVIFERFSQVPGLSGRRRGSGLGLTFCRLALDAQGGRIWYEPQPNGGSVFVFTLPAANSQN
jgi:signal transduction histidine kinase